MIITTETPIAYAKIGRTFVTLVRLHGVSSSWAAGYELSLCCSHSHHLAIPDGYDLSGPCSPSPPIFQACCDGLSRLGTPSLRVIQDRWIHFYHVCSLLLCIVQACWVRVSPPLTKIQLYRVVFSFDGYTCTYIKRTALVLHCWPIR